MHAEAFQAVTFAECALRLTIKLFVCPFPLRLKHIETAFTLKFLVTHTKHVHLKDRRFKPHSACCSYGAEQVILAQSLGRPFLASQKHYMEPYCTSLSTWHYIQAVHGFICSTKSVLLAVFVFLIRIVTQSPAALACPYVLAVR